jgi:hypothetical protein
MTKFLPGALYKRLDSRGRSVFAVLLGSVGEHFSDGKLIQADEMAVSVRDGGDELNKWSVAAVPIDPEVVNDLLNRITDLEKKVAILVAEERRRAGRSG